MTEKRTEIVVNMQLGDKTMSNNDCTNALKSYKKAAKLARRDQYFKDLASEINWKIYKANTCLGRVSLPLPSPHVKDPNCGIDTLSNPLIQEDFTKIAHGKRNRIKHVNEWFHLFKLKESKCNEKNLKRAWRKLNFKFHPDKFKGDKSCSQRMSLIVNAGKEVLENHPACQGGRHKRGDKF